MESARVTLVAMPAPRFRMTLGMAGLLVTWTASAGTAFACSYENTPFEIQADPDDQTPPATPQVEVENIERAREPQRSGCAKMATSCDDVARIKLVVEPAPDAEEVGYDFEITGDAPAGLISGGRHIGPRSVQDADGHIYLRWHEEEDFDAFSFELEIWAVDRAGNRSLESQRLKIQSDGNGCATAGTGPDVGGMVLLVAALWRRRRKSPN